MAKRYTIIILLSIFTFSTNLLYSQYSSPKNSEKFGIETVEINQEFEVSVYPNPVQSGDYITIQLNKLESEKPIKITIINIIGKELLSTTIDSAHLKFQMQKNIYPAGIYILKAKQNNEIRTLRLNVVR